MINKITKTDIEQFSDLFCANIKGFNRSIFVNETVELKRSIRGAKNVQIPYYQKILNRWNKSIDMNEPDFSVYNETALLQDMFSCWVMYSRSYIKSISDRSSNDIPIIDNFGKVNKVLDIGNGIGYSTAALKELFPDSTVIGYNVRYSLQWDICMQMSKIHKFYMSSDLERIGTVDLLFASEYFEHYEEPIKHLKEVLDQTKPRNIIVANSFGTTAIGHFTNYKYKNITFTMRQIRKAFNSFLRNNNYVKQKTNCWNDRPSFWSKSF